MKRITVILTLSALAFPSEAFSQWTFCGFIAGAGIFPVISGTAPNTFVVAGGPNGAPFIARSTNCCTAFTPLGTSGITHELYTVWASNRDTVFVGDGGSSGGAGGNARVYRTYNGGVAWTNILTTGGGCGFINGIVFGRPPNQCFGIVVSDPPGCSGMFWISKTSDCGNTWTTGSAPVSGSGSQNSVFCIDSLFYGFGLASGTPRVAMTTNGGVNWNIQTLPISGSYVSSVAFSTDKLRGFAATNTSLPTLARTTNGGVTWTAFNLGGGVGGYCNLRWIYGTDLVYLSSATGAAGVIMRSSNGGQTWTQMNTSSITGITSFDYAKGPSNSVCLVAIAGDGSVIGYTDNSLVGIEPGFNSVPNEFKLYQNYPNPFNATSKIKFQISKSEIVKLAVYDILGLGVATIVDQRLNPGTYEIEWDATNYPSGVYVYTLTSQNFKETRRLVLLK